MSGGGDSWYKIYFDSKENIYVKINYYHKYSAASENLLNSLELKEPRLIECTCSTQEDKGNRHCVRWSYPYALTLPQYVKYMNTHPKPNLIDFIIEILTKERANNPNWSEFYAEKARINVENYFEQRLNYE